MLAATLVLGVASLARLALDVGRPYGGYLEEYIPLWSDRLQIDSNTPTWWPNVGRLDLINHELLAINGEPYRQTRIRVFEELAGTPRASVTLRIHRGGAEVEEKVPIRRFTWADYLDVRLPNALVGICLWLLASTLYLSRPSDELTRTAAWALNWMAALLLPAFPTLFWNEGWFDKVAATVAVLLVVPMLGAALVHLALHFPEKSRLLSRPLLVTLYAAAALSGLTWASARPLIWIGGWSPLAGKLDELGFTWSTKYLLTLGLVSLALRVGWIAARSHARPLVRRQFAIIALGFLVASPAIVVFVLDLWGKVITFFGPGLDLRYSLLAVPLAFAFVILRYRSFRTADPMFLLVVVVASSALLASIGSWLLQGTIGPPLRPLSQVFVPIFLLLVTVSTLWSTQASWQGSLSRALNWERRSYASARQYGQRLLIRHDAQRLPVDITASLLAELRVEAAALWLWDTASQCYILAAASGLPAENLPLHLEFASSGSQGIEPRKALRLEAARPGHQGLGTLHPLGFEVVVPLSALEAPLGVLCVGKQQDEEIFDERDLAVIELVAQQVALVLLASRQIEELRAVPERLIEAQKQERLRIARDLHDTVQQRLGGLQPMLEAAKDLLDLEAKRASALLEQGMEEVQHTARMLTQIQHDLAPPELPLGLAPALEALAQRFRQHKFGGEVQLDVGPDIDDLLTLEARHELLLVVQQALDNIARHARAIRVQISLRRTPAGVELGISDDGRGFTPEQALKAQEAGHLGLVSMRTRLKLLGGELDIVSQPGEGTRLTGCIPLSN